MSDPKKKPTPQEVAKMLEGIPPLDFDLLDSEPWVRCRLPDGSIIKVRNIVTMIKRLPLKNPDGTYSYAVKVETKVYPIENELEKNR